MTEEIKKHIKEKLSLVPTLPGSYQMKNKDGIIIYVGKAKNLKNRLKSYFTGTVTGKTLMLVNDIVDFEYIVTNSELESLILEITLIKKYDPKYNILLKDDKSYPYIELTDEVYPTLKVVRNLNRKKNKNKSRFFGPYPNVTAARKTVDVINRIYPLRKCNNLGKDVCLYYHIGECLGYCKKDNIDKEKLSNMKMEIISFLNGNKDIISKKIEADMKKASDELNFEKALELKNMLEDINITLTKQTIDLNKNYNFDLFGYYKNNNYLSMQVFFIRDGILFGHHSDIFTIVDDVEEVLLEYIVKYYEKGNILPKEIIVNEGIDTEVLSSYFDIKVSVPKKGDVKKLLELANSNAKTVLLEREEVLKRNDNERINAIKDLESALNMEKIHRIEAFDNSHLFGTFYVGGMVVFDDFLPNKDLFRKFKISIDVKDDLTAMREVIYRRYYRVLMDELERPDLIIVDGGEMQVSVAKEIIDSLKLDIRVIGLKKDDKHRTNVIVDSNLEEINIDSKSNLFLFLTKIQDEVHRYAISYHRNIKSKGMLSSVLDMVEGIGEVRKKELLRKFGSLKKMKEASIEELEKVLGKTVAVNLKEYLKKIES
ncbi:MAG: excinuclease ABC subunit UvrC [Bacilli bacterium]|nr:excinuclease ABC subunit UvrC [Bacilli bacterium]